MVAVEADAVWVQTLRRSTCGSCSARQGCGHGLLNAIGAGRAHHVRALAGQVRPEQCQVGDRVEIAIPESLLLRGSALVYLLPLATMMLGAVAGAVLWPTLEALSLAGAGLGLTTGLGALWWHGRRHRLDPGMQPTLETLCPAAVAPVSVVELS